MSEQVTRAEFDALRAILADVASNASRNANTPETGEQTPSTGGSAVAPFWDVTICTGLTLTGGIGDDWDPRFDVPTATVWQKSHIATAHGSFNRNDFGASFQRRFAITWESAQAAQVTCSLHGDNSAISGGSSGTAQVKMNGKITEYTIGAVQFVLDVVKGQNRLVICNQLWPDSTTFDGVLWDETLGDKWVDPRGLRGYLR